MPAGRSAGTPVGVRGFGAWKALQAGNCRGAALACKALQLAGVLSAQEPPPSLARGCTDLAGMRGNCAALTQRHGSFMQHGHTKKGIGLRHPTTAISEALLHGKHALPA